MCMLNKLKLFIFPHSSEKLCLCMCVCVCVFSGSAACWAVSSGRSEATPRNSRAVTIAAAAHVAPSSPSTYTHRDKCNFTFSLHSVWAHLILLWTVFNWWLSCTLRLVHTLVLFITFSVLQHILTIWTQAAVFIADNLTYKKTTFEAKLWCWTRLHTTTMLELAHTDGTEIWMCFSVCYNKMSAVLQKSCPITNHIFLTATDFSIYHVVIFCNMYYKNKLHGPATLWFNSKEVCVVFTVTSKRRFSC